MKKIINLLFCAITAMAALSCNKETDVFQEPKADRHPMTFTATTTATRTTLNQVDVNWSTSDHISVFDGTNNNDFQSQGSGMTVTFSGEAADVNDYYAVYPYNSQAVFNGTTVTTTLSANQTPVDGTFADGLNINASKSSDKTTFVFDNVLSVVKFTLSASQLGGKTIKSVTLSSANYPLAGDVVISFGETCTAAPGTSTQKEVTLASANGLSDGTFYFVVLPNAGGEITLTFVTTDNYTATKTATLSKAFTAGTIKDFGTVKGLTWAAPVWKLVTDASTLVAGDKLVIASNAKGKIASTLSNSILTTTDATFSSDQVTLPNTANIFTLGGSAGAWTLTNSNGQLYATAAKKLAYTSNGTNTWTIAIYTNGDATIEFSSYGKILYNVDSPRFTTYTSAPSPTMLLPQLYREEPASGSSVTPVVKELQPDLVISDDIKKAFSVDDAFSFGNGIVKATYSNGEEKILSVSDVTVSGFDSSSPANSQEITLTYEENGRTATGTYIISIQNKTTYSVTYTVGTVQKVNITHGTAPAGSSETFINSYNTAGQMIAGSYQTLTLSGYAGAVIKGITLSMHSNTSKGSGHFTCKVENTTIAGFTENQPWNTWYNITDWSTSYKNVIVQMTNSNLVIQDGENVVLNIYASVSSLYNQSFTITYEL